MTPTLFKKSKATEDDLITLQKELEARDERGKRHWQPFPRHNDKEYILTALAMIPTLSSDFIQCISTNMRDDKDVVQAVLAKSEDSVTDEPIEWVSARLRRDIDVAKLVLSRDRTSWKYLSRDLRSNRDLWLFLIAQGTFEWCFSSNSIRADKEVVLAALEVNDCIFSEFEVSDNLRDDWEVVEAAVIRHSLLLQYASLRLRDDEKMVRIAMENHATPSYSFRSDRVFRYASDRLRGDHGFAMYAVSKDGQNLRWVSDELRDREQIVHVALRAGGSLCYASRRLKDDKATVVLGITNIDGDKDRALSYASRRLRRDQEVVRLAIQCHPLNIKFALNVDPESLLMVLHSTHLLGMKALAQYDVIVHAKRILAPSFALAQEFDFPTHIEDADQWIISHLSLLWHKVFLLEATLRQHDVPLLNEILRYDMCSQISAATRYLKWAPCVAALAKLINKL